MLKIESKENKLFKDTKKLKEKKWRIKNKKYLIEGVRIVEEAIKAKVKIDAIFLEEDLEDARINAFLEGQSFNSYVLSKELFKSLCSTEAPQGIIAIVDLSNSIEKKSGNFYILADKVQDPGNMGTIIRTAHAANAKGVIITKGTVDIYNEKTIRSTMGSIFYLPVIEDQDLEFTKKLIDNGYKLLVSALDAEKNFFEEDLSGSYIIAVGNEGNGVSDEIKDLATVKVKIPMPGEAESLNVSVACAIMIYEKVRQNLSNAIE
ncbi:TrmH family RNA methyltransferase [Inconstantimicrobium mannanitabidum]|uniref:TrmH family RNA methyltransferase n=1 Tax=Inconstantimicrobium mannanitabidum TaxID=1604901 RepID=UPI0021C27B8B|nr:RNA methyltransferase [Clostridium sp. TW13]